MKVYPWLDSIAAPVVGTKYALGEGCELLNKLDDTGWVIDGTALDHISQGNSVGKQHGFFLLNCLRDRLL